MTFQPSGSRLVQTVPEYRGPTDSVIESPSRKTWLSVRASVVAGAGSVLPGAAASCSLVPGAGVFPVAEGLGELEAGGDLEAAAEHAVEAMSSAAERRARRPGIRTSPPVGGGPCKSRALRATGRRQPLARRVLGTADGRSASIGG
jgi:hypothetical protein